MAGQVLNLLKLPWNFINTKCKRKAFTPVTKVKTRSTFCENLTKNNGHYGLSKELVYPTMLLLKLSSVLRILPLDVNTLEHTIHKRNSPIDVTVSSVFFACGFFKVVSLGAIAVATWFNDGEGFEFGMTVSVISILMVTISSRVFLVQFHMPETILLFNTMEYKQGFQNFPHRWHSKNTWIVSLRLLVKILGSIRRCGMGSQLIFAAPFLLTVLFTMSVARMFYAPDAVEHAFWCIPNAYKNNMSSLLCLAFDLAAYAFAASHAGLMIFLLIGFQVAYFEPLEEGFKTRSAG